MIKLTDNIADTESALLLEPILGARIHTLFSCYGNDYSFLKIWSIYNQDKVCGVLTIMGKHCTLVVDKNCDFEELILFLSSLLSDIEALEINSILAKEICTELKLKYSTRPLMRYIGEPLPQKFSQRVEKGSPKDVFPILKVSDDEFAQNADYPSWLYDTHRRVSRGLAQIYSLKDNEDFVAVGGYYCGSYNSGVIASIATLPNHRNKGYGKEIVLHITSCLFKEGKNPYLIAATNSLVNFYMPLGYQVCDYSFIAKTDII